MDEIERLDRTLDADRQLIDAGLASIRSDPSAQPSAWILYGLISASSYRAGLRSVLTGAPDFRCFDDAWTMQVQALRLDPRRHGHARTIVPDVLYEVIQSLSYAVCFRDATGQAAWLTAWARGRVDDQGIVGPAATLVRLLCAGVDGVRTGDPVTDPLAALGIAAVSAEGQLRARCVLRTCRIDDLPHGDLDIAWEASALLRLASRPTWRDVSIGASRLMPVPDRTIGGPHSAAASFALEHLA